MILQNNTFKPDNIGVQESLYFLANGYIGARGFFEEGYPGDLQGLEGVYMNGFYDKVPLHHAEIAYGFAENKDKMPKLFNPLRLEIYLDGERALLNNKATDYSFQLDVEEGLSKRAYVYETKEEKKATLSFKRMASFTRPNLLIQWIDIDYDGEILVKSILDGNARNEIDLNDPRMGEEEFLLDLLDLKEEEESLYIHMKTKTTKYSVEGRVYHNLKPSKVETEDKRIVCHFEARDNLSLEKRMLFSDDFRGYDLSNPDVSSEELLKEQGDFLKEQRDFLDFECGNEEVHEKLSVLYYYLLSSAGRDAYSNLSAKGLSGEGYEGHYFWDTEIYAIPFFTLVAPDIAENLIKYRIRTLPQAEEQAKKLSHKGAAFPWRTISGEECSGYFPAGSAQYHISFDIVHSIREFLDIHPESNLLEEGAKDLVIKVAEMALSLGSFDENGFHIHTVTGPDEYTALVSDNFYTNALVRETLHFAYELSGREDFKKAADEMVLLYDEDLKIHKQDATFLDKPRWDFEASKGKHPLLLHYHPMAIYRHQVLKQADTVLTYVLIDDFDEKIMKNSFDYYEPLTTHDSSLSKCIHSIMAARFSDMDKAMDYFNQSMATDFENTHGNTAHGLHMANTAGTWLCVFKGFLGLMVSDKVKLWPRLPEGWGHLSMTLPLKGRRVRVELKDNITLTLLEGEPLELILQGESVILEDKLEREYHD